MDKDDAAPLDELPSIGGAQSSLSVIPSSTRACQPATAFGDDVDMEDWSSVKEEQPSVCVVQTSDLQVTLSVQAALESPQATT